MKKIIALLLCSSTIYACHTQAVLSEKPDSSKPIEEKSTTPIPTKTIHGTVETIDDNSTCPHDMVEVKGDYCPAVIQNCLKHDPTVKNVNGFVRCLHFAPTKCVSKKKIPMHFCMDKFEYPNKEGAIPDVMVSWYDMKANCEKLGKRLCQDYEWSLACEGPEMLPYPYGYDRDETACNIDKTWRAFDAQKLANPKTRQEEVDRLSQRVPSGSMPRCVSPYGVHDMTGNVDEFVVNSSGHPYKSGLAGGHWTLGARNRCSIHGAGMGGQKSDGINSGYNTYISTTQHSEIFQFYAEGGRCCKNIK